MYEITENYYAIKTLGQQEVEYWRITDLLISYFNTMCPLQRLIYQ